MVRVGFSTHRSNLLSTVIRWLTGSKVSHTWLLIDEPYFGIPLVMEATEVGFRLIPYEVFAKKNDIVEIVSVDPTRLDSVEASVKRAAQWLGDDYDFGGLLGSAVILLGRRLKKRWKNPFASSTAMFCSEAVVLVLKGADYPGTENLDPEATTPEDLLDFLRPKLP